jgi:hypothetical protein
MMEPSAAAENTLPALKAGENVKASASPTEADHTGFIAMVGVKSTKSAGVLRADLLHNEHALRLNSNHMHVSFNAIRIFFL